MQLRMADLYDYLISVGKEGFSSPLMVDFYSMKVTKAVYSVWSKPYPHFS